MNDEFVYLWAQWGVLNFERYQFVLNEYGDLKNAWEKITSSFLAKLGFGSEKAKRVFDIRERIPFHKIIKKLDDLSAQIICIEDDGYPQCLKSIADPPPFIFARGKFPSLHKALGIVGTRMITPYGRMVTEKFTKELVQNGFIIVSGLAIGVDSCAHMTTLKNNGITIAVLGSGLDEIYPASNRRLADEIIKCGGMVISEYPFGAQALAHHFPARNRIISGLSRGVLVTEGGVKSGALITARFALEQGREVFAVPNNITKISLSGTNHLVRRGEAKLVENVEHILEEFQMKPAQQQIIFEYNEDEKIILTALSDGGMDIDRLLAKTSWDIAKVSEILTGLHLKGLAREEGRRWVLS
jgi:DNA processing protein